MAQAARFSGINHISVTVRDLDESLHFYRDMVGGKAPGLAFLWTQTVSWSSSRSRGRPRRSWTFIATARREAVSDRRPGDEPREGETDAQSRRTGPRLHRDARRWQHVSAV